MKKALLIGIITGFWMAGPAALAAPPVNFGGFNYQVNGNLVTITDTAGTPNTTDICSQPGFTCNNQPISGNGFLQLEVTDTSGQTYFQTIIADPVNGGFINETFVAVNNGQGGSGLASSQTIGDLAGTGGMSSTDVILSGRFLEPGDKKIDISQTIWNEGSGYSASDFQMDFRLTNGLDANGDTIVDVSIATRLGDAAGVTGTGFGDSFAFDQQVNETAGGTVIGSRLDIDSTLTDNSASQVNSDFSYSVRQGTFTALDGTTYGNTAGGLRLSDGGQSVNLWSGSEPVSTVLLNNGINFDWAGGDTIVQVLIGQSFYMAGGMGMGNPVTETSAYVRFNGYNPAGSFTNDAGTVLSIGANSPATSFSISSQRVSDDPTIFFAFDAGVSDPFI